MNNLTMFAKPEQDKEIYAIFKQYADIFPHIRFDYLQRKINKRECIYKDGVAITFTTYKRKNKIGNCTANKGDVIIHQIANKTPSNGTSKSVIVDFLGGVAKGKRVWLSVRGDNTRACKFYEKMKFKNVGNIDWMSGLLTGFVFCYDPNNLNDFLEG